MTREITEPYENRSISSSLANRDRVAKHYSRESFCRELCSTRENQFYRVSDQSSSGDGAADGRRAYQEMVERRRRTSTTDRGGDLNQDNPKNYWKNYYKSYWQSYWQEYYRGSNQPQDRNLPNQRYDRREPNDRVKPSQTSWQSKYDQYLPPQWRNGGWRKGMAPTHHENERGRRRGRRRGEEIDREPRSTPGYRGDVRVTRHRPGNLSVLGAPTITPQKIDAVLRSYRSPAAGLGQVIYDLGVKSGINPAVALGFFIVESTAGRKGVARTTKSWGNIKGRGPAGSYKGFRRYNTWEQGVKDWFRLIKNVYVNKWGRSTLPRIIQKYAPSSDNNDEGGYVRTVERLMRKWSA